MFPRKCTSTICEYKSTKEDDVEPALWQGFKEKDDIWEEDWMW